MDLAEPYTFRPFDFQSIYWHKNIVYNMRGDKMEVFRAKNPPLGLMFSRNTKHGLYTNVYVTKRIADRHCLEEANVAPLYTVAPDEGLFAGHQTERRCNLTKQLMTAFADGVACRDKDISPEDIFHYIYAVLYSPDYRTRYAAFLKIDFPRLPLTSSIDLFRALAKLGGELVALHLMESPKLDKHITKWIGGKAPVVKKITYSDETIWTDKAQTDGFRGVPESVWNFHIGGYQVCEKWLKDRKGRTLTSDDLTHYHRIVVALAETIRIMAEIDAVIATHGGWPKAFTPPKE
jgi:predicted helicase